MKATWVYFFLYITITSSANWHVNIGVKIGNINDGNDYFTAPGKANIVGILQALNDRITNVKQDLDKNTYSDSVAMYGATTVSILVVIIGLLMRYIKSRVKNASIQHDSRALQVSQSRDRTQIV